MKALLPVFDETRKKPYYLQLYDYIRDAILSGEITEGEKLPSLRSLSKSTHLSITTIEQAYNQLLVEGYVSSRAQSGFYVSRVAAGKSVANETVYPELNFSDIAYVPAMQYDPECFDFNKWKKCMNKVLTDGSSALHFEGDPLGEPALRHEIARYLYVSRGVSCDPSQIIIAAGTQQITNHLSTILRKLYIENVALENPGYAPVRSIFRDRGFAITSVDVGETGLILEKLPANIRSAVYVSPSNHSFTGAVMPVGRRYELLEWAEANDSYIIEDDYDSELRYFGRPIPALKSLDRKQRVIYLGSFSSTLFAAVKISYMVLPQNMADIFTSIAGDYSQTCSKLEQLTLAMFMETGKYQTHIRKLRKLYSQKLAMTVDTLRREAKDFIDVTNTSSGISLILKFNCDKHVLQIKKEAESLGVSSQILSPEGNSLILYYSSIPLAEINSVLSELVSLWRKV